MAIEIGKTYMLLTNNPYLIDEHTADYAEVVDIVAGTTDVVLPAGVDHIENAAKVRFPNGDEALVRQEDLVDPESVPFKKGDTVRNTIPFGTPQGTVCWPSMTWKVKQVTYGTGKNGGHDLDLAVMVCDSMERDDLSDVMIFSTQLEKA